jgi:hypothetical protein
MSWSKQMVIWARHHGDLGARRAKVKKGGQGKRTYSDEFVAMVKLELETKSINEVVRLHGVSVTWARAVKAGVVRADVLPAGELHDG